jgi:ABC-2 type transport system permease protein
MFTIYKKEMAMFFNSLIGYVVLAVFLVFTWLVLWIYPDSNVLDFGYADLSVFFEFCPYLFLFLIPAITMRMFAEEYRSGTIEFLLTKPIYLADIILGKYFSALMIVILALLPTGVYYFSVYSLGNPVGNIDTAAVVGSYFGLILLGAAFASMGVFASVLTKNQVVAFVIAAVLSYFFLEGISQISNIFSGGLAYYVNYFSLQFHYSALGKGLIDSRNVLFLVSFSMVFLLLTQYVLNRKRA